MAARKRKAAEPTPEQWLEVAEAATLAPDPETVEKIGDLEGALHRLSQKLAEQIHPTNDTMQELATLLSDKFSELDRVTRFINDGLSSFFQELTDAQKAADKTVGIYNTKKDSIEAAIDKYIPDTDTDEDIAMFTWITLAKYINAEVAASPDKYKDTPLQPALADKLVILAATRARADGKEIPSLKVEHLPAAFQPTAVFPTIRIQKHTIPIVQLMNFVADQANWDGEAKAVDTLPAKKRGRNTAIQTLVFIKYDSKAMIDLGLTEKERQVSDAVMSIWVEAQRQDITPVQFTTKTIFQAMPGAGEEKPSKLTQTFIEKTIEKLSSTRIKINATDEMRERKLIADNQTWIIGDQYFQITDVTTKAPHSSTIIKGYLLQSEPIILQYARMTGQVITINAEYLQIRKVTRGAKGLVPSESILMTSDRRSIAGYMLRRIAIMKNDFDKAKDAYRRNEATRKKKPETEYKPILSFCQQSHTILFDTLFKETQTQAKSRIQEQRNRDFCFDALEYWKATGLIKGYKIQTKARKIRGIEIELE